MKVKQISWCAESGWNENGDKDICADLVFAFGDRFALENPKRYEEIRMRYPDADILMASSSGDIRGTEVCDEQVVVTAIEFEKTTIQAAMLDTSECNTFYECGEKLALSLPQEGLAHIFVLSDGHTVNGTVLVRGMSAHLPEGVAISGGLAGDGPRFEKTLVGLNESPQSSKIIAIGFYGKAIKVGCGSIGGWDPFGPIRRVTRSKGNVLYELDGQPALELYKKYLGERAKELPGSALLFPLTITMPNISTPLVRTVLGIDEENGTMTFAGNIPEGCQAQLMKANFERLIDGAALAAKTSYEAIGRCEPDLAILVSCVGRRMVLGQRTEEELESVRKIIGPEVPLTGFYSYGEIAPTAPNAACELHNQTMTITTFREDV